MKFNIVVSLFDGISCGAIALHRAGHSYEKYIAYEIEPNAMKISQANFPEIYQCGDVTTENFTKYRGKVDLLIGGSPCQNFSFMGTRNGLKVKNEMVTTLDKYLELKYGGFQFDGESYLFWEFVRALKEIKPKYFLLENVKMAKEWRDIITDVMGVEPIMIDAGLVSAQRRKRLYWTNIPNITEPIDRQIKLSDVINVEERKWKPLEQQQWCLREWGDKRKIDKMLCLTEIEKAGTLTTKQTHTNNFYRNADKTALTVFTADEAEILQTLPKGYTKVAGVAEGKRFHAIGNGWCVDVIAHIFKGLKEV